MLKPSLDRTVYERVASLGLLCMTARALESAGLRQPPLPFDWTAATPKVIEHCLSDGFADYLERSNYERLHSDHAWRNKVFHQRYGLGQLFNHHDVANPIDYRYMIVSVDRFKELLASDCRKMFVIIHDSFDHEHFTQLFEKLFSATDNAKIVAIERSSFSELPRRRRTEIVSESDSFDRYAVYASSGIDGISYFDEADNGMIREILHRYRYQLIG